MFERLLAVKRKMDDFSDAAYGPDHSIHQVPRSYWRVLYAVIAVLLVIIAVLMFRALR